MGNSNTPPELLVLSHLRWDFVFQRPQHLMTRFARDRRVFFFEEPILGETRTPQLHLRQSDQGVHIAVPYLPSGLSTTENTRALSKLLQQLVAEEFTGDFTSWYYTPMALPFSRHLRPRAVIYDCMDELSAFKFAPPELLEYERELLKRADLVFTGGHSLYEAKKNRHASVYPFPSSIEYSHFARARARQKEPADQAGIPHPRLGFFGVIDERMNLDLLREMAEMRPDWQFVMIGPVVKIDPATLPRMKNIHYLGKKDYQALPAYLSGWDLAMMPFALNESTRFISPTKTPEYLAAGRPVVSTSIRDVVRPYGENKLVQIADDAASFVRSAERAMQERRSDPSWLKRVDHFLSGTSWDITFQQMDALERAVYRKKSAAAEKHTFPAAAASVTASL